jgi:hypothetical protein
MKAMTTFVSLAAGALLATASLAQAPAGAPAGATAVCKDGSYWTGASKSGACSGHKGVQTWYGATAGAAPAAAPVKAAPAAPAAASAKAAPAAASYGGSAPSGATAICKDGTYWTGTSKSGACSGHKGVQTWYGTTAAAAPAAAPAKAAPVAPSAAPAKAAPPAAMASGPAPAGATGLCKDGTYWTGASKSGACSGHQGVQAWYGAAAVAAAPAAIAPPVAPPVRQAPPAPSYAPAPAAVPVAPSAAPAPGGGAGLVWLNPSSKTYHCPGDKWYGKTKTGQYVTEQQAVASGYHPDHGKTCSK